LCNEAIVAYCRIDVLNPPAEMVFGTWNHRPLNEKEAAKLAKEMEATKFSPFALANLLPLVISPELLDPSCIKMDPNVEAAPMLKLTEEAKAAGTKLQFAGGRHRRRATELLRLNSNKRIADLEQTINDARESKKVKEETMRSMERMMEEEKAVKESVGVWGVIVYNAGE
jgi:uncharacterized protein YbaP (TraB family)